MPGFQSSSLSKIFFVIFLRFCSLLAKLLYYRSLLSSILAIAIDASEGSVGGTEHTKLLWVWMGSSGACDKKPGDIFIVLFYWDTYSTVYAFSF